MSIWGLHVIDLAIVLAYLLGMLYIGQRLAKGIKDETDFYLAGRKLGKVYQFFMMFGGKTDANGAASITSEVYRQGVGGVWIGLQTVFMTPFYWFFPVWFRRVRLISTGDLYEDRFGSKALAGLFAVYGILIMTVLVGFGYLASGKTMQAILTKPPEKYTTAEKQMVADFRQYQQLKKQYEAGTLAESHQERYETLANKYKKGEMRGFVSYLSDKPWVFYCGYGCVIAAYVICGGFKAAVVTNVVQGVLIIVFSFILVPFGLAQLGGFSGLHSTIPAHMFDLVGAVDTSEYTWYSILALVLTGLVGINGGANAMQSGSAKNEYAVRLGVVTGAFAKRFMMLAWVLCGLIAIALYSGRISDPDETWGVLTHSLLGTGAVGLMIAGILAANMSSMDAGTVAISALFVRNLYTPLVPGRSERHYVLVGRYAIMVILALGIFVALGAGGIIPLLKVIISLGTIFGSVVLLIFFWRRLTVTAVFLEVFIAILVFGILPIVLPHFQAVRRAPSLLIETEERAVVKKVIATEADVQAGLAEQAGERIAKTHTIAPKSIFFDSVAYVDPDNPAAGREGVGRFHLERYIPSLVGVPVESFTPAGLLTTRFIFSAVFPLILLFAFSYLTKPADKERLDRFYVKMKTPIAPTLEEDAVEVAQSFADPQRFDHLKIFPNSNWEFCRWTRQDTVGFVLLWIATGLLLGLFKFVFTIGS